MIVLDTTIHRRTDLTGAIDLLQMNGPRYTACQEFNWGADWHVQSVTAPQWGLLVE